MLVGAFVSRMGPFAPCTDVWVFAIKTPAHVHLVVPAHWSLVPFCPVIVSPYLLRMTPPVAMAGIVTPFCFLPCVEFLGGCGTLIGAAGCWGQVTHMDHNPCSMMGHGLG